MEYILGIDLGTTNSCTYYKDSSGSYKLLKIDNSSLLPSVVSFRDDIILVGKQAENRRILEPMNTVYAFKRLTGRVWESSFLQATLKYYTFDIVKHEDSIRINIAGDKLYAIEEFSAFILEKIRETASKTLRTDVTKAVITVPAFFDENQRRSVKDAGAIAGLDVLRIINEPTAAALAYGYQKGENQKILVYDLGGGTFDVTILDITGDIFEVVATIGDTFLGGEDFTNKIITWIEDDIKRDNPGFCLQEDLIIYQRIREVAENAKKELSTREQTEINLPFLFVDKDEQNVNYSKKITRDELNELIEPIVNKTIKLIDRLLKHIDMDIDEIDNILLVGGQTRTLLVKSKLEAYFGKSVSKNINPDESVALGAAIHGNLLNKEDNDSLLLDVISKSMGIMISGGYFEKIIEKDSVIPCSFEKEFTTIKDNQEKVEIHIFQGEESKIEGNTYLGHLRIDGIPPMMQGEFKVNIRFIVNSEGILTVEATDLQSKKKYNLVLKGTSSLSASEMSAIQTTNSITTEGDNYTLLLSKVKKAIPELATKYSTNTEVLSKLKEYSRFVNDLENMNNINQSEKEHFTNTLEKIIEGFKHL